MIYINYIYKIKLASPKASSPLNQNETFGFALKYTQ